MRKPTWIVCSMDGNVLTDENDVAEEFTTARDALKRAKQWIETSSDSDAWIYRLSHIVSRPPGEPTVHVVS